MQTVQILELKQQKMLVALNGRGDTAFWSELDHMWALVPGRAQSKAESCRWSPSPAYRYKAVVSWKKRKEFYNWLKVIGASYEVREERRRGYGSYGQPWWPELGSQR